MKKLIAIVLVMCLATTAYAAVFSTQDNVVSITISGRTAYCSARVRGTNANDRIVITLSLWKLGEHVQSWSISGTGRVSIDEYIAVDQGRTYILIMNYTVNGIAQDPQNDAAYCE